MEMESCISLGGTFELTVTFSTLENVCLREYIPLFENDIKENQDRPIKTTSLQSKHMIEL